MVGGMFSMLPYDTGICCYAFIYFFLKVFIASVYSSFILFFLNLVLINRRNGPRYQRVLALRAFLTGAIPKGLVLRKLGVCVACVCLVIYQFVSGLIVCVFLREFVV